MLKYVGLGSMCVLHILAVIGLNVCVPPKFKRGNLIHNMMVLGEAFGRPLGVALLAAL